MHKEYLTKKQLAGRLGITPQHFTTLLRQYRFDAPIFQSELVDGKRLYEYNINYWMYLNFKLWNKQRCRWDGVKEWTSFREMTRNISKHIVQRLESLECVE